MTTDNATSGAQNHDVTVNLAATDNLSSINVTEYGLDGGAHWTTGRRSPSSPERRRHDDDHLQVARPGGKHRAREVDSVTIDATAPAGGVDDPSSVLHGTVGLTASPSDPDVASVQFLSGRPAWVRTH